ncbi:hypothetical protein H6F67_25360 [Microcoleus sp. FACHB-1515]|uniref:hypothetical protein n=1 Tax=Cyanophyceae TaxID=3028117 RepID=UPI0016831D24|nr:hypothetical protein [Microcoleus sp. FACHB-1515]MBD2093178.1 hypothetical protein [Microcoleus sp. FACHB-1515]
MVSVDKSWSGDLHEITLPSLRKAYLFLPTPLSEEDKQVLFHLISLSVTPEMMQEYDRRAAALKAPLEER